MKITSLFIISLHAVSASVNSAVAEAGDKSQVASLIDETDHPEQVVEAAAQAVDVPEGHIVINMPNDMNLPVARQLVQAIKTQIETWTGETINRYATEMKVIYGFVAFLVCLLPALFIASKIQ